uniref:Putative secreted protein n=1 Tax=Amblyomma americanum TaxID=6943 RepID=A0A0C9SD01_AMBAM
MQTALVLALVLSVACVQFLPGDAAPGAQGTEYQDFCDVDPSEQMKFFECLKKAIPTLKELLNQNDQNPRSLLDSVCSGNDGENTEEMTEDVAKEFPAIERCLSEIA